ncbi:family 43 glycosylhydrolase [bacterium]|nr:family 43 glycosylhydrolase [bacterium]
MRLFASCLLVVVATGPARAGGFVDRYCNPLQVLLADPYVLRHEGTYYLYATSDVHNGYFVWTSDDLVHWVHRGYCFRKTETSWGRYHFWAPEVVEKGGVFYLFYSASPSFQIAAAGKAVCVATAESPLGPFVDAAAPLLRLDHDTIDGHCFLDDDGRAYLFFVLELMQAGGNQVYVAPLSADLLSIAATPAFCLKAERPWESAGEWHVNEAPFVVKHEGWYYLLYSGNGFSDPNYAVGYATSRSPLGPWKKYEGNPILSRVPGVSGPGHNALIKSPDGSEWFSVHHTHMWFSSGGRRQLAIDRVRFVPEATGPARLVCDGPTLTPQPLPSGAKPFGRAGSDDFAGTALDRRHWIVFNESPEAWRLERGALVVRPAGDAREHGDAARNVFLQYAPEGDFAATVEVRAATGAFLCLWRDHDHFVRLAVGRDGRSLVVGEDRAGEWREQRTPMARGDRVFLRLVRKGSEVSFSAGRDGKTWTDAGRCKFTDPLPMIGLGVVGGRREPTWDTRFLGFAVTP